MACWHSMAVPQPRPPRPLAAGGESISQQVVGETHRGGNIQVDRVETLTPFTETVWSTLPVALLYLSTVMAVLCQCWAIGRVGLAEGEREHTVIGDSVSGIGTNGSSVFLVFCASMSATLSISGTVGLTFKRARRHTPLDLGRSQPTRRSFFVVLVSICFCAGGLPHGTYPIPTVEMARPWTRSPSSIPIPGQSPRFPL